MIVLDTTVLVYAVGAEHRFAQPCRELVSAVGTGVIAATTSTEVLQEFAHVRARRRTREDAAELTEHFANLLAPLLTVDETDLHAGLRVFREHSGLGSFDSVLIATAQGAGFTTVVSADAAFADVPGVRHVVPDEAGISALLGRSGSG